MEFSSPLAAMRPPPCPQPFGCRQQAAASPFGTTSFNFRELNVKKSQTDYFNVKALPVRGSSPTASLAADLSSNFHIDQSPQLPTPRRSLFTSGLFGNMNAREGATTPPVRWEGVTTTPMPSSSPGFGSDLMDVSPLPHKPVFSLARRVQVHTTTVAEATPTQDEDMISPRDTTPIPLAEVQKNLPVKPFARPSLSRTKCLSTSTVVRRGTGPENQLPAFKFGAGGKGLVHSASITTLDECFQESPPQDRVSITAFGPPRPRQLFSHNAPSRRNGSPSHNNAKKVVQQARPRKLFRRSLSMFEHPGDVMKQDDPHQSFEPSGLQSIMDVDEQELKLPHFVPTDAPCSLPRINQGTLINVINGGYDHVYDNYMLIDCRFEYEFNGGHIEGAENYNDKDTLARDLFDPAPSSNTLLIFHCEYSQQRAPLMAQHIRKHDRTYNATHYPKLTYPEVYILDGGYSAFFKIHRSRCFPPNYVEMDDENHELAMERGLRRMKQRKPLQRSATYAFGQRACQAQDSPSRPTSGGGRFSCADIGTFTRTPARRMLSY